VDRSAQGGARAGLTQGVSQAYFRIRIHIMLKQTPLTAAGGTYNNHYHFLFEPRGSKISVYHEHFDSAHVNEVIGLNALEAEKPRAMASLET
jgi:hypothetical protein